VTQSIRSSGYRPSRGLCRGSTFSYLLVAALLAVSSHAFATPLDDSTPDPGAQALELGRAALAAYTAGSWQSAYDQFGAAEQIVHSPVFVLYMARCKRNSGQLLAARELFRAVVSERIAADTPGPWQQAVASAHAELGTLQQNVPSVWIRDASASDLARTTLDGRSVPTLMNGMELELDPGKHVFEISHPQGSRSIVVVQLSEGRRRVPVVLSSPSEVARTQHPAPASPSGAGHAPTFPTRKVVGYTALGLGALGVTLGAISGLSAKSRSDSLRKDQCDSSGDCYPDARAEAETASAWATVSTVGFVFGGAFLAAGTAVFVFTPSPTPSRVSSIAIRGTF